MDSLSSRPNFTFIGATSRVAYAGEKPQNRPLSKTVPAVITFRLSGQYCCLLIRIFVVIML